MSIILAISLFFGSFVHIKPVGPEPRTNPIQSKIAQSH